MKHCPKCKREYEDDSLRFCLEDGAQLDRQDVSPTAAEPTLVLPVDEPAPTTISSVARPDIPLPAGRDTDKARVQPTQGSTSPVSPAPGTVRTIIAVLFVAGLVVNIISWAAWGFITARRIPLVLLFLIVMLLAFVRAPRHPKASLLVGIALGFDLIETFIYIIINRGLLTFQPSLKIPDAQLQTLFSILSVLDDFALAMILVVLTAAVFAGRNVPSEA